MGDQAGGLSSDFHTRLVGSDPLYFGNIVDAGDMNGDGWKEIMITQSRGGNGSGATGRVYVYEVNHGQPSIEIQDKWETSKDQQDVIGVASDPDVDLSGVEWSFTNASGGVWHQCVPSDAAFDSGNEEFVCDIPDLRSGTNTIYFRTFDSNSLYMSENLYAATQIVKSINELTDSGVGVLCFIGVGFLSIVLAGLGSIILKNNISLNNRHY